MVPVSVLNPASLAAVPIKKLEKREKWQESKLVKQDSKLSVSSYLIGFSECNVVDLHWGDEGPIFQTLVRFHPRKVAI